MKIPGALPAAVTPAVRVARAYGLRSEPATPPAASGSADALRSVLTDEERAYFDQLTAMGPISYAPTRRGAPAADAPRGLRLDVTG